MKLSGHIKRGFRKLFKITPKSDGYTKPYSKKTLVVLDDESPKFGSRRRRSPKKFGSRRRRSPKKFGSRRRRSPKKSGSRRRRSPKKSGSRKN